MSANDCSTNVNTDANNCGRCGNVCPTGNGIQSDVCTSGSCDITCDSGFVECFGQCFNAPNCTAVEPFNADEIKTMIGFFLKNINIDGQGGVCASPSTSQPDYFYHWQRDSAISMREYMHTHNLSEYLADMQSYVQWVLKVQFDSDPNGIDIRGEPKFYLPGGACYDQGWLRPQNDGCALRAATLIEFCQVLLANGMKSYVTQYLWNGDATKPGIARDLDYVIQHWADDAGDPWEEVRGQVFFEKFAARRAMLLGAQIATTFGDDTLAATYTATAQQIVASINSLHWDPSLGIIQEVPATRPLDSAVHLGILYSHMGDGYLDPSSQEAQSSIAVLVDSFANYTDFSINAKDDALGLPGLLVGRYLNDNYNGGNTSQPGGGNPWILCTAALGEFFYTAAELHVTKGAIAFTEYNRRFFEIAVEMSSFGRHAIGYEVAGYTDAKLLSAIVPGSVVTAKGNADTFKALMHALTLTGDGIMLRLHHHIEPLGLHCPEELNKDTGESQGAQDLTWSYGTIFGAVVARDKAMAGIRSL